jgi:outer membrane receptor protein involved in Fe transport
MKLRYLMSCAVVGLLSGTAHAATAADKAAPATVAPATDPAPVPQPDDATPAGDIIVTAQRRSESIQKVPMTLQALSGEQLEQFNVVTFDDLLKFTPNVTFGSNGPGAGQIFMRGLSAGVVGNQSSATIAYFPNVAIYLDDQSMQFPARNADVYMADMQRVEVLEGPQGTLFGGGAEAGAVRYITNKPVIDKWEGHVEGMFGGTSGGATNNSFNATLNIPVIKDKLALRVTGFEERQGGYIDNLPSTFQRSNNDGGVSYFNLAPNGAGLCPNGKPAGAQGLCYIAPSQQSGGGSYSNSAIAGNDINPVTYQGARVSALWDINPDWNLLVSESMQYLDAEGSSAQTPIGLDLRQLGPDQTELFAPSFNKDNYWSTSWTLNGKIGDWKLVYTGSYMVRHIEDQQDYTNYSRTAVGTYYQCTGLAGGAYWGNGPTQCNSPVAYWHDQVRSTHQSHEVRISSPEDKRIRLLAGAYYEQFKIDDIMDFHYKSIPQCTDALISENTACSGVLQAYPQASLLTSGLKDATTAFGEETQRGYSQYAFFGSVDIDILPNLTLTGGTRYYHYSEYQRGAQYQTYAGNCYEVLVCTLPPVNTPNNGNVDFDLYNNNVTYHGFKSRGVLTWKPGEHTMVYGLFSQGFRPGGFNRAIKYVLPDPTIVDPTQLGSKGHPYQFERPLQYAPDTLTNWEVGLKTDLFDHKVQLNLSAYYMIWENTQVSFYNPAAGFGNTSFVTNGPTYHVKGIEAQVVTRPVRGLTVQGAITYNDSKQTNSPCFKGLPGTTYAGTCIQTQFNPADPANPLAVLNPFGTPGGALPFSPNVQGSVQARYEWEMHGLKWFTTGSVSYTGVMYSEPNTYPSPPASVADGLYGTTQYRYRQPGYALVEGSIGFQKDFWSLSLFAKNITNSNASTFTSSPQFIEAQVPVRPRTYGVRISADF